jgi:hypothetical protein
VRTFEAELPLSDTVSKSKVSNRVVKRAAAQPAAHRGSLALFALVKEHWLQEAFAYYESAGANKELRFSANSPHLGPALGLRLEKVYFKASGKNDVIARARFLSIETENPAKNRLPGYDETCESWNARFYYGFCDLSWTKNRIPVTSLCRYPSGKPEASATQSGNCGRLAGWWPGWRRVLIRSSLLMRTLPTNRQLP